jgi:hypothetical protein
LLLLRLLLVEAALHLLLLLVKHCLSHALDS